MNSIEEKIMEVQALDVNDLDKCYEMWEPLGMLDKLDDIDTAKKIASEYTKMAKYLLFAGDAYMSSIEVCAFPTVRKIFASKKPIKKGYSPKVVCDLLQDALKQIADRNAVVSKYNIDPDAEACSAVADSFFETL